MSTPYDNAAARPGQAGRTLAAVMATVEERRRTMPAKSYVAGLLRAGADAICCKLAEETGEAIKASREQGRAELIAELCDLFFHALVLMAARDISLADLECELARRHGISGIDEKAARGKMKKGKGIRKRKAAR